MCLLTVTPEFEKKSCAQPNRVVAAPKPCPAEPSQSTPVAPHYVTCEPKGNQQQPKEQGRITESEWLQVLLAAQRGNGSQQAQQPQQQQQKPAPQPPKPREEHHYHHYNTPTSPIGRPDRRRSSISLVSVQSFESVRRKVRGLWQRVTVLERDKERREWLAEAAAAAAERRRERSRSPRCDGRLVERFPEWHGRGEPMRERRRERCREWY